MDEAATTCDRPSRNRYGRGCRCDGCRVAQREYQRAYYRRIGGNQNRKPHHKESAYRWSDYRKAASQARRAQKMGADAEQFQACEIYDRDNWICGICGESVQPSVKYPDPMSASLDHIVPLSLDGPHTRTNTRLAHLACNVKRGNRVA